MAGKEEESSGIFKSKEELEQYLSNLGIEYRYSCYGERNPEGLFSNPSRSDSIHSFLDSGCYLLGDFMAAIQQDFIKAAQSYMYACDAYDYGKACNQYGSYKFAGRGTKKDVAKATELFRKSCLLGYGDGCYNLGILLTGGDPEANKTVKVDLKEGLKAFEKGCQLGTPDSCFNASTMHMTGSDVTPENPQKAFEYAKIACDEYAHFAACNNLHIMYTKGLGTEKNEQEAKRIKGKLDDYLEMINKGKSVVFGRTD